MIILFILLAVLLFSDILRRIAILAVSVFTALKTITALSNPKKYVRRYYTDTIMIESITLILTIVIATYIIKHGLY